jgi:1-acyl-sn-glycerol-3-phosphate acyltransferase
MNQFIDLWRRPLPHLRPAQALLLRMLMLPNLFLMKVEGAEHLRETNGKACIYAFNHNNAIESLQVPVMLVFLLGGRRVSFVIDWMFARLPVIGWLMNQIDPVYAYHKRSTISFLERNRPPVIPGEIRQQCLDRLAAGTSIGIFPEGTRNGDVKRLLKAKPGIGYIVLESHAPVIPVGIEFHVSRSCLRVPFIGRMTLRFGSPMHFDAMSASFSDLPDSVRRIRQARLAGEVSGTVMLAIAELCGKSYPYRDSSSSSKTGNPPEEAL